MEFTPTFVAQCVVFMVMLCVGLPLLALPWLAVIWLFRKLFGMKESNNG